MTKRAERDQDLFTNAQEKHKRTQERLAEERKQANERLVKSWRLKRGNKNKA